MTHASLFSGIGGFDLAAEWVGWKNSFNCEINEFCNKILKYHFPKAEHYDDITTTDFTKWRGKIDVLSGGFPCQPFSVAGRRKGAEDDRYLWPQMLRAIREIKPTWVVGENVGGIISMVQPGSEVEVGIETSLFGEDYEIYERKQQFVVETVCSDLESEGYSVQPILIPACAVGAPHRRDRVWFIANKIDENPVCIRCDRDNTPKEKTCIGKFGKSCTGNHGRICRAKGVASSDSTDSGTESLQQTRKDGIYTIGVVADTESKQSERYKFEQPENGSTEQRKFGRSSFKNHSKYSMRDWKNFPTQPPVCRGNDGIPFDVDDLTVSFAKWRAESIKAYGNAIVPQVVYEIFRAINKIENGKL